MQLGQTVVQRVQNQSRLLNMLCMQTARLCCVLHAFRSECSCFPLLWAEMCPPSAHVQPNACTD